MNESPKDTFFFKSYVAPSVNRLSFSADKLMLRIFVVSLAKASSSSITLTPLVYIMSSSYKFSKLKPNFTLLPTLVDTPNSKDLIAPSTLIKW